LSAYLTITNTHYSQSFGLTSAFTNGVWSGEVTLSTGGGITYFYTNANGRNERGYSNRFFVSGPTLPSVLDHFEFDYINTQTVDVPFKITITATDQYNQTLTSYNGTNTIAATEFNSNIVDLSKWYRVNLGSTDVFVNGTWSGQVSLPQEFYYWVVSTSGGGKNSDSNGFAVYAPSITQAPSSSATPYPTKTVSSQTPTIPEFPWTTILPLSLAIIPFFVAKMFRKRK
jgi:hypothetical protein